MNQAPRFFVPAATPENQESVYSEFARLCHRAVPPTDRRVFSIAFSHNGEHWTATVGQTLTGVRYKVSRVRGEHVEREERLSDPATVLAIFPSDPFMVLTNHRVIGNVGSRWESPFMAGQPDSVSYFSVDKGESQ